MNEISAFSEILEENLQGQANDISIAKGIYIKSAVNIIPKDEILSGFTLR